MGVVTGSSSLWPSFLGLSRVVQPDTIVLWHRAGFRAYWRWKSGGRAGSPRSTQSYTNSFNGMSKDNALWGTDLVAALSIADNAYFGEQEVAA